MPYKKIEVPTGFIAVPNHAPIENLTGRKFGNWFVVAYLGASTWQCRCDCGKELKITNWRLKTTTRCNRCANALPVGESAFNDIFDGYRRNALKANREFRLTREETRKLFKDCCAYCGCEPASVRKDKYGNGVFAYNGIDRVVNELGYVTSNCVSCCAICNHMKHTLPQEKFLKHVKRIAAHVGVKKEYYARSATC
jgi:hypothetical protein